jgi:hypothetical protein
MKKNTKKQGSREIIYRYPKCVEGKIDLCGEENKRFFLKLPICKDKNEAIAVILKNPSKANKEQSDYTVSHVVNYIKQNKYLKDIGDIIILNLIPFYETNSAKLKDYKDKLKDKKNLSIIERELKKKELKKVIIAWGNHPKYCSREYKEIKDYVINILKENKDEVYFIDKCSKEGNPKHGQVWRYADKLIKCKTNALK